MLSAFVNGSALRSANLITMSLGVVNDAVVDLSLVVSLRHSLLQPPALREIGVHRHTNFLDEDTYCPHGVVTRND